MTRGQSNVASFRCIFQRTYPDSNCCPLTTWTRQRKVATEVRVGVNQEPTVAFKFLSSLIGFGGLKPIVYLLFRTSAMQMYSSPRVSDRTPNPSCCTYSRARSLGKPKSKGSPHRAYT